MSHDGAMYRLAIATLLAAGILGKAGLAQGQLLTFNYDVLVTATHGSATNQFTGLVGPTIHGSYTFDENLPDSNPVPIYGLYIGCCDMTITVDGATFGGGVGDAIKIRSGRAGS